MERSVEEYTREFEYLMLKCDITSEASEQTIARYLRGLREEIADAVKLQPYTSFDDVRKLATTIEKQRLRHSRSKAAQKNTSPSTYQPPPNSHPKPKPSPKTPSKNLIQDKKLEVILLLFQNPNVKEMAFVVISAKELGI